MSLPEPKAEVRPRLAHGGEWKAFVPQTPTGWLCNHKPCVPSPYPHQFTYSFPFLTCKYSCDVSQGWQVQARLRCKCSPSCAKTSCGEHHVQPNRSAQNFIFSPDLLAIFPGKILRPADFFRSRMLWGLKIKLPGGRRWAPRERFAGQVLEVKVPKVRVLEVRVYGFRKVPKVRTSC